MWVLRTKLWCFTGESGAHNRSCPSPACGAGFCSSPSPAVEPASAHPSGLWGRLLFIPPACGVGFCISPACEVNFGYGSFILLFPPAQMYQKVWEGVPTVLRCCRHGDPLAVLRCLKSGYTYLLEVRYNEDPSCFKGS